MEGLKPPRCLNLNSSNMSEEWKIWKQSFETYMVASGGNEKSDLVKIAILLHVLGEETMRIYDTLDITEDEKKVYATVMTKINNYFVPQVNTSVETYKFNCRVQGQSETFDSFVTDLKRMSALCDFGNARDRLIKDKIVQGVCDQNLKRKLLAEANLTLASAVEMGRAAEQTQQQLETMERQSLSVETIQKNNEQYARKSTGSSWQGNKVQQPSTSKAYQKKGSTSTPGRGCGKCGLKHEWGQCPAFGKTCRKCKALNHFARMCKSKLVYEVNTDSEDDGDCFMGSIQVEKTVNSIDYNKNDWYQIVELTDCDKRVKFKLDTGAQVNVLPMSKLKQMKVEQNIVHSNVTLRTFANTKIPVVGKITLQCKANDRIKNLEFQVVDFDKSFPILGLKGIEKLDLLQRSVSEIKLETVFSTHRDLFRGIGDISIKKCKIVLKDDAVPKVSACRKIPFKLRDKVKDELNRMEKLNIIQKVTAPTDWVNPIVVVNKPDKNVRICLDPFELNNAIKREHFKLPTFEELTADLNGTRFFSTLDAHKGFYQIRLEDESSDLTTFNTPFGRYKFLRLPFGLSCAPEMFHATFTDIFKDIEGVKIYIDDILIAAKTQIEHDKILKQVLDRAKEVGVKFNKEKCIFGVSLVKFMGHILSQDGIQIDKDRIKAILEIPVPGNKADLSRFLGIVTFVSRFIPNMTDLTCTLRGLLKKDVTWNWSNQCQTDFDKLKECLSQAPVLHYFDANKPATLSVDSSQNGLGAVLLQDGCPVIYASKTLTDTQQKYAQIEKETLAIVHGCERFHQFIYGQKVVVETDHKPLVSIFQKPLDKVPLRLQRLRLRLQGYDLDVRYKPGKMLYIADALSRASIDDGNFRLNDESDLQVNLLNVMYNVTDEKLNKIIKYTEKDDELQKLKEVIQNGWPVEKRYVPPELTPYWSVRSELSVYNGLIVKGLQIVIPRLLRREMIDRAHYNHMGVEKTTNRARDCMYWPMMFKEIKDKVDSCSVCLCNSKSNQKETLVNRDLPTKPWEIVAMDIFQFEKKEYLLIVDLYSKYPEVAQLRNMSSESVVNECKAVFARHGKPEKVYSDNGTNFVSREFRNFAKEWEFECTTSSAGYSQSNGFIERHVQTIKNLLKKSLKDNKDIYLTLLEYRNTPLDSNSPSPAQLSFNRRLRSMLPYTDKLLKPEIQKDIVIKAQNKQYIQKYYYDKQAKDLVPLQVGDRVLLQTDKRNWKPGVVRETMSRPRSYKVELESGSVLERNRRFLRKDSAVVVDKNRYNDISENNVDNEENVEIEDSVSSPTSEANVKVDKVVTNDNSPNNVNAENIVVDHSNERNIVKSSPDSRPKRITKKPSYLNDYTT